MGVDFEHGLLFSVQVGADGFFTKDIAVAVPGLDGVVREIITLRYYDYGEQHEIAAPESYLSCRRRRLLRRPHPWRALRSVPEAGWSVASVSSLVALT